LHGRDTTTIDDVRRVAPLVLAHRSRRGPFDPPVLPSDVLDRALETTFEDGPTEARGDMERPMAVGQQRRPPTPPSSTASSSRGRAVGDAPSGSDDSVAVLPTVRAVAARRAEDPEASVEVDDLRSTVRVSPRTRTIVVCVDLSGSMGAPERAEAATGTVLGLLADAYQHRDRVALVGFRGSSADVLVSPTSSIEVARNRLDTLATGGETPLADGLLVSLRIAIGVPNEEDALIALLTDGRATGTPDAFDRALDAAVTVRRAGVPGIVLDCEAGGQPLGLAKQVADAMSAAYMRAVDLEPDHLAAVIRAYRR
jgi:magnesium chelatase subunit D